MQTLWNATSRTGTFPPSGDKASSETDQGPRSSLMAPSDRRATSPLGSRADTPILAPLSIVIGEQCTTLRTVIDGRTLAPVFDRDGDGSLSMEAFLSQYDVIGAFVTARLGPVDGEGATIAPDLHNLPLAAAGMDQAEPRVDAIDIVRIYRVPAHRIGGVRTGLIEVGRPYRIERPQGTREGRVGPDAERIWLR